jgi:hypothetical protein
MPHTVNKRFTIQAAGTNSGVWGAGGTDGDDINTGICGLLDTQLAAVVTSSLSSSNVTLSYANVQSCMLRFTGTLLANIVVSPDTGGSPVAATYFRGFYYWENLTTGSFTVTVTTAQGSAVLPQGRRGVLFNDGTNGPRVVAICGSSTADPVPAGSRVLFYNASAPSGWTAVALNDYAIKIVTNGGGGVASGSVAYSTLFARTATDAHALTEAELAGHDHLMFTPSVAADTAQVTASNYPAAGCTYTAANTFNYTIAGTATTPTRGLTESVGGGNGHTHDIDMRVQTAAFVLATRD